MEFLIPLSFLSVFVFSISATLSASEKKFDIFGISFITFLASVGGGTVRDILLGNYPLFWIDNQIYILIILSGIFVSIIFKSKLLVFKKAFFLFDAIGIGVSSIVGTSKALNSGINPLVAIFFGLITGVFGGIIRDVMTNEIPLILRKEVYASACLSGSLIFVALKLTGVNEILLYSVPILFTVSFRLISVKYKISLPTITL